MTMKERIEVSIFGSLFVVGLPALIIAAQRITG